MANSAQLAYMRRQVEERAPDVDHSDLRTALEEIDRLREQLRKIAYETKQARVEYLTTPSGLQPDVGMIMKFWTIAQIAHEGIEAQR